MLNKLQFSYQKNLIFEIQTIKLMDQFNVSRETLNDENSFENELYKLILQLKDIRINNILKNSSRSELKNVEELWDNLNSYLIEEKYKKCAGILLKCKPVAASKKGLLITLPAQSLLDEIEKKYDLSKELFNKIFDLNYKIVYITSEYWHEIRPKYVKLVKNNELDIKDELHLLSEIKKIKNKTSVNEFKELIEMEEK